MNTWETAQLLHKLEISFIPVGRNKRPLLKWEQFQNRLPTKPEIHTWFKDTGNQIAIIGGKVSGGLAIIDFDDLSDDIFPDWAQQAYTHNLVGILPFVQTGNGIHVYFRTSMEITNKKLARKKNESGRVLNLIETRGEGGYAICPPSLHPNGKQYKFIGDLGFEDIPLLSEEEAQGLLDTCAIYNELEEPVRKKIVFADNGKEITDSIKRRYAYGELKGVASDLAAITQGDRNNRLYATAFRMGRYIAAGLLKSYEVEEKIRSACERNGLVRDDGEYSFRATLLSGIADGKGLPMTEQEMEDKLNDNSWTVEFFSRKNAYVEEQGNGGDSWLSSGLRTFMTEE